MKSSLRTALTLALGSASLAAAIGACSGDTENNGTGTGMTGAGGNSSGTATGGAGPGSGGGIFTGSSGMPDGGLDPDSACAAESAEATLTKAPIDIIVIIDNSGSMTDDIIAVQNNINSNFANILDAAMLDYKFIFIARHGNANPDESVCISPPLAEAGTMCGPPAQAQPGYSPKFDHYSIEVASHDSLCRALSTYTAINPDEFGKYPMGWSALLRQEAIKVFLEITDDGVSCSFNNKLYDDNDNVADGQTAGTQFDADLLALDPVQFGDAVNRKYVWHSIIGMKEAAVATDPHLPGDPMVNTVCSLNGTPSPGPGTGYQHLSIITGGLRFPICQNASFDVVFQKIAEGVVAGAQVNCEFAIPPPPSGQTIDLNTVVVRYTPGGVGAPIDFTQVKTAADCVPNAFYIENGATIKLCADSCAVVQADDKAKVDVLFTCSGMGPQ